MKNKSIFVAQVLLVVLIVGCKTVPPEIEAPDYSLQLPPGALALRKVTDPAQIPDFTVAGYELGGLSEAVKNSLNYMGKPSSKQFYPYGDIAHARIKAGLQAFSDLLDAGFTGKQLNDAIKEQFDVYISVGCDGRGTVLFTGYYTPIFAGSLEQSERFKYPLYKQPDDLIKGPSGEILGRRTATGQTVPYPSRAELESSGALAGSELVWLSDPFEAYIAHVQGSAKIRLSDGELVTVGYAASNGREYHSVAKDLISDGKMSAAGLSLSAMIDYFKTHTDQIDRYINRNERFVFFRVGAGEPRGSLNEPVIATRSIATDKSIYPRASLAFMVNTLPRMINGVPTQRHYTGFVLDQDTGGAIRAPGRCDVYMGTGDLAGKLAGQTYQEGKLYYLILKPHLMAAQN